MLRTQVSLFVGPGGVSQDGQRVSHQDAKRQEDLESVVVEKKPLLQMVRGYDNVVDVDMFPGNFDVSNRGCVGLTAGSNQQWTDNSVRDRWMRVEGIKKDIWSVMEDFSKVPGGKDSAR